MLGTVLKDKEKIEQTIEELDRYTRDALKTTRSMGELRTTQYQYFI